MLPVLASLYAGIPQRAVAAEAHSSLALDQWQCIVLHKTFSPGWPNETVCSFRHSPIVLLSSGPHALFLGMLSPTSEHPRAAVPKAGPPPGQLLSRASPHGAVSSNLPSLEQGVAFPHIPLGSFCAVRHVLAARSHACPPFSPS